LDGEREDPRRRYPAPAVGAPHDRRNVSNRREPDDAAEPPVDEHRRGRSRRDRRGPASRRGSRLPASPAGTPFRDGLPGDPDLPTGGGGIRTSAPRDPGPARRGSRPPGY